jgi:hypothetical protein
MPHAYVTQFVCDEMISLIPSLTEEMCENDHEYKGRKYVDCHCKPEDHIAAVASLRYLEKLQYTNCE